MKKEFDVSKPFHNKKLVNEVVSKLRNFNFKLFGKRKMPFYLGKPTVYEFDLNMGFIHFTEQDFLGISNIFKEINRKWHTQMTYCIYPAVEKNRNIIINVRGSPQAPGNIR